MPEATTITVSEKAADDAPIRQTSATSPDRSLILPGVLLAVGVAVHLLFLLSLRTGWLNPLFEDSMHRFGPGCDFFSIYAAGIKARLGESVYTIGGHVEAVPYAYAFRYAPLVAYTLGAALSLLPALTAYGFWLILCEMALLRNMRLTLQYAPDRRTGLAAVSLWLLFSPYCMELYVGQFTFLTASLVFWAYLTWQESASRLKPANPSALRWADLYWVTAVLLKMMPLLYLPVALLRGRWRSALLAVTALTASGLYFVFFPQDWATFVTTNADPYPTWHAGNQGLMALLYALSGEQKGLFLSMRVVVLVLVGIALLGIMFRAWRTLHPATRKAPRALTARRTSRGSLRKRNAVSLIHPKAVSGAMSDNAKRLMLFLYAAGSATYLLTYKDVWEHHYVLLLPPLVLLVMRRESPWLWGVPFLVSALPSLFVLYDLPGLEFNEDPQIYWHHNISVLHHGYKPLAPLWLMVGLLWLSLKDALPEKTAGLTRGFQRISAGSAPRWAAVVVGGSLLVASVRWARAAILNQRQVTQAVVWPKTVFQTQSRRDTCGPAALAAVCRHFGIPAREDEIARFAGTSPQGTSMLGLRAAAEQKGLAAEGLQMTVQNLREAPCPCILFFQKGHYAVLVGVRGDRYYVADPSLGQRILTEPQLMSLWHGQVLLVGPSEPGIRGKSIH